MRPYVVVNVAGAQDFNRVDRLKASSDAVMVGIGTVLADDPSLTVKGEECRQRRRNRGADEHPARIVVDSRADPENVAALKEYATVIVAGHKEVDLSALMAAELGLIRAGLVDEIYTFIGNMIIGGSDAPTLADGKGFIKEEEFPRLTLIETSRIESGILQQDRERHPPALEG